MIFHTFFARVSMLFLLLILLLGSLCLLIAFYSSRLLFDEVEQLLNRDYAGSIAEELQPLIEDEFSIGTVKNEIHYMMVLNPMVEIYLLDLAGHILAYFTYPEEKLQRVQISTDPIEQFIMKKGLVTVFGDDPRTANTVKPFSAASLRMGKDFGYVYVILRGQSFDRSIDRVSANYYLRSGLITFLIAVISTVFLGLLLFFILTRRLRQLVMATHIFKGGQYDYRINIVGKDEIAALGNAFNDMAGSIEDAVSQLHESEQQRSDLIANISHDLRSPLTSIRGHLETILLKDEFLSFEKRHEFLEITLKNVSSFQKLVNELFDLAKLEAGQLQLQEESFSLTELVQDIVLKYRSPAEKRSITIHATLPDNLSVVKGDIALMERVIVNLMENALNHTPENGNIVVGLTHEDTMVQLTIKDSGLGIALQDIPHIFDRFYRADRSRSRENSGTGLGLAIAKEIVELHNGRISAVNSDEGGALFTISLYYNFTTIH